MAMFLGQPHYLSLVVLELFDSNYIMRLSRLISTIISPSNCSDPLTKGIIITNNSFWIIKSNIEIKES
jgi:hypothetical protein